MCATQHEYSYSVLLNRGVESTTECLFINVMFINVMLIVVRRVSTTIYNTLQNIQVI
jgi:hypothetical protein